MCTKVYSEILPHFGVTSLCWLLETSVFKSMILLLVYSFF
jgi:hypothetical protein